MRLRTFCLIKDENCETVFYFHLENNTIYYEKILNLRTKYLKIAKIPFKKNSN